MVECPECGAAMVHRRKAYAWMQREMGLAGQEAHIGLFTQEQCARLVALMNEQWSDLDPLEGEACREREGLDR